VKRHGFTLLETLLALMVFSVAVVALVEAVHQIGEHTLLRRHEAAVQERMRSLLVEHTRMPDAIEEVKLQDGDVSYTVTHTPLELKDRDGQPVSGLFEVRVTASWQEGRTLQQASAETWVYPPLFR
jgi:prepilin-type N-terminal cleavage/methylation domain-containing protein